MEKPPNLSKHGVHRSSTKLAISGHDGGGDMRTGRNMGCRVAPLNKQARGMMEEETWQIPRTRRNLG